MKYIFTTHYWRSGLKFCNFQYCFFKFLGLWHKCWRQGYAVEWRTEAASGDCQSLGEEPQNPAAGWGHISTRHREWKGVYVVDNKETYMLQNYAVIILTYKHKLFKIKRKMFDCEIILHQ